MRTFYRKCIRCVPKGSSLCNPDKVLRTSKPYRLVLLRWSTFHCRIKNLSARSPFQVWGSDVVLRVSWGLFTEIGGGSVRCITIHARKTHQRHSEAFFWGEGVVLWLRRENRAQAVSAVRVMTRYGK